MMDDAFSRWCTNAEQLLNSDFTCIFNDQMCIQTVMFDAVHDFASKCDPTILSSIFKALCREAVIVTRRQLSDFLDDGYFTNMSSKVQEQLIHCRLTNLIGESSFGDFDFDKSKRRNANLHNRSAVHSVKRNKTSEFLASKSESQVCSLFQFARKRAPEVKKENKELEVKMINEGKEKFVQNQDEKIVKTCADITKRSSIILNVKKHGGPFLSLEELDGYLERNETKPEKELKECVKHEVRFHKFVMGRKTLKRGSLKEMINALRAELKEEPALKIPRFDSDDSDCI